MHAQVIVDFEVVSEDGVAVTREHSNVINLYTGLHWRTYSMTLKYSRASRSGRTRK